jgi:uncharacterized protein (DUF1501 family)
MAVAGAAALAPMALDRAVAASIEGRAAAKVPTGERTLVVVQMAGGNDGLNTIIPANDDRYYELRPLLAQPAGDVLALDTSVGLHRVLGPFKELWDEGVLGAVEGVGYPDPSFSHFQSMDTWQTTDPAGRTFEGWLGRYLEGIAPEQEDGVQSLSVGRSLPRSLWSHRVSVPMVGSIEAYRLQPDPRDRTDARGRTRALMGLYATGPGATPYGGLLESTLEAAQSSSAALQEAHAGYTAQAEYPDTQLGSGLRLLAEAISGDVGLRVGHVRIGGFDTHASQVGDHERLLSDVAESIRAFYRDLQAHGRDGNVVIMTWSEFGRRVTENASSGTDHGSAGPMFVVGTPIKGGLYGERPSLGDLERNNLKFTTDFRSVYATVLEDWLGAPSELLLGGRYERLPFLRTEAMAR